ncbi:MAG: hypothetical protein KI786_07845 [Mameliella sp.]|nr:hypothetical protein [Phaeodactylibacter sp.]
MKNVLSTLLLLAFAAFCLPLVAQDEDFKISIQGTLKDANSLAVEDGQQTITFRLYDDMTGGTVKHEETGDVQVRGGVYNYLLGTNEELEPEDFVTALYLSLEINGNELFPRTQMTYSPYSLSVSTAQQAIRLTSGTETCSGSVGDIKHSILKPTEFADENGDCWVPMDGRAIPGTKLADTYGWANVPDMSGLFVRAAEYNEGNDPDRTTTTPVASLQNNSVGPHSHNAGNLVSSDETVTYGDSYLYNTQHDVNPGPSYTANLFLNRSMSSIQWLGIEQGGNSTDDPIGFRNIVSDQTSSSHSHTITGETAQSTGNESRPENMNFYIYIRVD